jgi:hypothetical protein
MESIKKRHLRREQLKQKKDKALNSMPLCV